MDKKEKLYERALATCVVMLIVCVILKLFGVQWFNLDTGIPLLNAIDRVVMGNKFSSFFVILMFRMVNGYLILKMIKPNYSFDEFGRWMLFSIVILIMCLSSFGLNTIAFVLELILLLLFSKKFMGADFKDYLCSIILNIIYQALSMIVRDIGLGIRTLPYTVSMLLMIDYYLLLTISVLYLRRKETSICGEIHRSFSSLVSQLWKKHSQNSKQCFDKEI